ncbi:MAG TPA: LysR substrate-binding domain-containing protein [Thermohalobaculum sp.]|nr:LysR substrate-binding domain-containing protein [Thermohalobaculum sp.]
MHITLRHLQVFEVVMEGGSISRAATLMNLSQPAVSIALSKFEQELGFRLFHRAKGYFAPTSEAMLLHNETEQSLLSIERVQERAREISAGGVGVVSIASNGACAINLLPWVIAEFQQDHPEVRIDLKVRSSRKIASWVAGRQIDIGLIDAPVPIPGLNAEIIRTPCVCILQETDPLCQKNRITPENLAGRSVISITGDHSIDRQLDRLCAERGVSIERRVSSSYFAIARNLVRAGAGMAIVDAVNGKAALGDGVTWRPFEPAIYFELALIMPPERELPEAASTFLAILRKKLPATQPTPDYASATG